MSAAETLREIAKDEQGNVLWDERYIFAKLSAPGEYLVRNFEGYTVISSKVENGIVNTIVKRAIP